MKKAYFYFMTFMGTLCLFMMPTCVVLTVKYDSSLLVGAFFVCLFASAVFYTEAITNQPNN